MATIVKSDQKAPFSIATAPRCRGEHYSFPWIAPLYSWYVPYIAKYQARRYQVPFFKSLVWLDLGLNPGLLDHWWTLYPLYIHISMTGTENNNVIELKIVFIIQQTWGITSLTIVFNCMMNMKKKLIFAESFLSWFGKELFCINHIYIPNPLKSRIQHKVNF